MLLHRNPFGGMFDSVIFPKKDLNFFSRHAGPNMAFFHPNEGLMFFSPVLRRIWPEASFGSPFELFRDFLEECVVPAEMIHLKDFWEKIGSGCPTLSDMFVIKTRRMPEAIMGLVLFSFPWGRFFVVVPGETTKGLQKILDNVIRLLTPELTRNLEIWVQDSERESLVSHFLKAFPEDFFESAVFSRTLAVPFHNAHCRVTRISYLSRNGQWQRVVGEERSAGASDEGEKPSRHTRHYGVLAGGELSVVFTVFTGGILPIGTVSVSAKVLENVGPARFNAFLHEASSSLASTARRLVSDQFRYFRKWTGQGFFMDSLEEIARLIEPETWQGLIVLPFWTGEGDRMESLVLLDSVRYTTDIIFVDPEKGLGCILLRNTDKEKVETVVREKFRQRLQVAFDEPVTVEEFQKNH